MSSRCAPVPHTNKLINSQFLFAIRKKSSFMRLLLLAEGMFYLKKIESAKFQLKIFFSKYQFTSGVDDY